MTSTLGRPTDAVAAATVLVVDDSPDMRLLARVMLERAGLRVVGEAADGLEALERVHDLDPPPVPTVILLDNQMPRLTGLEAAAQILAQKPNQLIVMFSAFFDDDLLARATDLGIAACVSKTDVSKLATVIKDLVAARP